MVLVRAVSITLSVIRLSSCLVDLAWRRSLGVPAFDRPLHLRLSLSRALDHSLDRFGRGGRNAVAHPLESDEVPGNLIIDACQRTRSILDRDVVCQTQDRVESILVPTEGLFEVSYSTQGHQFFGFPQTLVGKFEQQRRIACAAQREGDAGALDPPLKRI
jgi:hypothetical protein